MAAEGGIGGLKTKAGQRWQDLRRRRPGLDHIVRAYAHFTEHDGNHLAAAITYFSFLALFPLILLGVSVLGFVLNSDESLRNRVINNITSNAGGALGDTLTQVVNTAISNRGSVGAIGLVGVLLAGLGWISNLRTAIDVVWGIPLKKRNFIMSRVANASILGGLGLGVVVSLGLTAGGSAATHQVLSWIGADNVTGAGTLTRVIGLALAVAGDMLIFGWVIIGLPDVTISRRIAVRTTLIAAIGFEVLKLVGTVYIARSAKSTTYGALASVVGVLIWIDLVSRFLLYCVSWAASAEPVSSGPTAAQLPSQQITLHRPAEGSRPRVSPAAVAAGLLSAGAALGATAVAAAARRNRR